MRNGHVNNSQSDDHRERTAIRQTHRRELSGRVVIIHPRHRADSGVLLRQTADDIADHARARDWPKLLDQLEADLLGRAMASARR